MERQNGTDCARVVQVIETVSKRGIGTEKEPARVVTQYWDFEGNLLAENDPEHCIVIIEHDAKVVKEYIL